MTCIKSLSNGQKWLIALAAGLLFAIVASNAMYQITDKIFSFLNIKTYQPPGGPTLFGLILHAIVFGLLLRLFLI